MLGLNYAYLHGGVAEFYRGEFTMAEASFWDARSQAVENFGADSGLRSIVDVFLSGLNFWQGETALSDIQDTFLRAIRAVEKADGWFEVFAMGLDVTIEHAVFIGAFDILQEELGYAADVALTRDRRQIKRDC